jgi:NosR/NirI family nitrous oxide reductase transcriptional regulator
MGRDFFEAGNLHFVKQHARQRLAGIAMAGARLWMVAIALLGANVLFTGVPAEAKGFGAYLVDVQPAEVFPGADRFGPVEGNPPAQAAYQGDRLLGYVFEVGTTGYSGKTIRMLAGLDQRGVIVGLKVIEHHEPILLAGIPPEKLTAFIGTFIGRNVVELAKATDEQKVDAISGATVTAIVINSSVSRFALRVAKVHGLAGFPPPAVGAAPAAGGKAVLANVPFRQADWQTLLGDGSIRRLHLLNSDVDAAFKKIGVGSPEPFAKAGVPTEDFIDLYVAPVAIESIGRNLVGDAEYERLKAWLAPGQQALLVASNGDYSFRGSGFVRGGIFDRFQLAQDQNTILFKDHDYRRLAALAQGMPEFQEIGLFRIPADIGFDPTAEWRLDLLAQRPTGPTSKAFTSFPLAYTLPARFVAVEAPTAPVAAAVPAATPAAADDAAPSNDIWKQIWRGRIVDISILSVSLAVLTLIFFFQDVLVKHARLFTGLRVFYLLFSLFWIGIWAKAQLSVVNVFTFVNAVLSGSFTWQQFLLEPLIFILWCGTAVSLLFWGRGPFCGWLCPFGAAQELINRAAKFVGIRQVNIPFHWHERIWPLKYVIFLALLGLSFYEIAMAERFAEVEPFKTAIMLRFARDWPFVAWAIAMLAVSLFIERFFCRYLCPLGAALAIPGRMRMFEWLKRRKQCGFECQLCAKECTVQAIHPLGQINPNECIYCMQCQVTYWDDHKCPPLILKRTGRGKKRPQVAAQQPAVPDFINIPGAPAPKPRATPSVEPKAPVTTA